jgi:hypothetical protein
MGGIRQQVALDRRDIAGLGDGSNGFGDPLTTSGRSSRLVERTRDGVARKTRHLTLRRRTPAPDVQAAFPKPGSAEPGSSPGPGHQAREFGIDAAPSLRTA